MNDVLWAYWNGESVLFYYFLKLICPFPLSNVSRKDVSSMNWLQPRSKGARRRGRERKKKRIWMNWRRKWTWWVSELHLHFSLCSLTSGFSRSPASSIFQLDHPSLSIVSVLILHVSLLTHSLSCTTTHIKTQNLKTFKICLYNILHI